ncbi:MAG: NapC/NirT family cytochrome c [Rubrivivax sp.]|nr:NapC/NirT family cytochrome c [Rubrivivax sp.]
MSVRRWGIGALWAVGAAGAVAGIVFWGGFNTAMEATNSMAFCISCHEMQDNVYQEYLKSPHYRNASGVRAICSDCHVPKAWGPKVWRKIQASNELYHHLRGSIDTPEKFEAKRAELAEHVWATMAANDSRECRNCHSWDAMDHQKQTPRGAEKMQVGKQEGKTCIDCHKGIAHALPKRDD